MLSKWYTSCLLVDASHHLMRYGLMQGDQRGAKQDCSGTVDNLLIDRMVCQDVQRGHRNLSMAWIDVSKAYNSVDHRWLVEMFKLHRFPEWFGSLIGRLSWSWNSRIVTETKQGCESSEIIHFKKGLPQGNSLCPTLFTLCLNPIAWKLRATSGYKLSKPVSCKVTHLAPVVQRPDNFIRWIRHYLGSKIHFTLKVVQGFRTLPSLAVVRVYILACTRGNTEIFAQIETVG